jgi:hypothetical protein
MSFLFNSKRKMYGDLTFLLENVIGCITNVFSLITMNEFEHTPKHAFYAFVDLYNFSSYQFI